MARRLVSAADKSHKVIVLTDGAFEGAAGLVRQADVEVIGVGKATGNDNLQAEGTKQKAKGHAQEAVGEIKDAVKQTGDKLKNATDNI